MTRKKMGRPTIPEDKKLTPRSIALSKEEHEFIANQNTNGSNFIRALIQKAMKEAVINDK